MMAVDVVVLILLRDMTGLLYAVQILLSVILVPRLRGTLQCLHSLELDRVDVMVLRYRRLLPPFLLVPVVPHLIGVDLLVVLLVVVLSRVQSATVELETSHGVPRRQNLLRIRYRQHRGKDAVI